MNIYATQTCSSELYAKLAYDWKISNKSKLLPTTTVINILIVITLYFFVTSIDIVNIHENPSKPKILHQATLLLTEEIPPPIESNPAEIEKNEAEIYSKNFTDRVTSENTKKIAPTPQKNNNQVKNSGLLALRKDIRSGNQINNLRTSVAGKTTSNASTTSDFTYAEVDIKSTHVESTTPGRINIDQTKVGEVSINSNRTHQSLGPPDQEGTGSQVSMNGVSSVFNKNRSILTSLYERERRVNRDLKGKIIFNLTIDGTGKVVNAQVLSSTLGHADLEKRLLARIKTFRFDAHGNTKPITINYPIDFMPS